MVGALKKIYRISMSLLFVYIWYRSVRNREDGAYYEYEETTGDRGVTYV